MSLNSVPVPGIRADRSLLLPGPVPPLSHLGATLFRRSAHSALAYALYHLGQPAPESPPLRFVALRPYLDAPGLSRTLGDSAGGGEILGALLAPAGVADGPLPKRLAGFVWFHRRRLKIARVLARTGRARSARDWPGGGTPALGPRLSALLPALGDALLGDLVAALERRQRRRRGETTMLVQSREAARFLGGARADLECLGPPDPSAASWHAGAPAPPPASVHARLDYPRHRLRGGFRERYRLVCDRLRPHLLALGRGAVDRGRLEAVDDAFFLPFDLLDDLDSDVEPVWLKGAIAANRAEWRELLERPAPADTLGDVAPARRLDLPPELAPLTPLA